MSDSQDTIVSESQKKNHFASLATHSSLLIFFVMMFSLFGGLFWLILFRRSVKLTLRNINLDFDLRLLNLWSEQTIDVVDIRLS